MCAKCRQRKWRSEHPLRQSFSLLKHHANRRRIPFLFNLESWLEWCVDTNYLGSRFAGEDVTVDRTLEGINPLDGKRYPYCYENCEVKTRTENTVKYNEWKAAQPWNKTT